MLSRLRSVSDLEAVRENRWYSFQWRSKAIVRTDHSGPTASIPDYPFILRQSSDRFIVMSSHAMVVQAFFRQTRLDAVTEFPRVNVGSIVDNLTEAGADGREYRMGLLFGSLEGYGRSLRTIGLWGDDIADAKFFHDIRNRIGPFRISLRDTKVDREIASIGSQGEVSLYYRGLSHLDQTDRLLKYLTGLSAISWSSST
ncbi:MAG: hypothetical protein KF863_05120 [Rubrivivax sp.]|nr:hypothetical protein [Rubrivivax sp.]